MERGVSTDVEEKLYMVYSVKFILCRKGDYYEKHITKGNKSNIDICTPNEYNCAEFRSCRWEC